MRRSSAIRATAWVILAAGVAAPLLRKRVNAPAVLVQAVAFAAPVGLCVAVRRSRARDVAACALQMWAYVAAYKFPHDDPHAQRERTRFQYPLVADRVLGLGELPTVRLQRSLARVGPDGPRWRVLDGVLVWTHWSWFMVPHGSLLYILSRHPERFPRAAASMYAVFDLGASFYWIVPTAPPWYAVAEAEGDGVDSSWRGPRQTDGGLTVRRMMAEYGEHVWKNRWGALYSVFGGNPLAAMPSLHFATSLMAALLLLEVGPIPGALGFSYTLMLGFALVYLGEHYVVDLLGGAVLTAAVHRVAPRAEGWALRAGRVVSRLEALAHEAI